MRLHCNISSIDCGSSTVVLDTGEQICADVIVGADGETTHGAASAVLTAIA